MEEKDWPKHVVRGKFGQKNKPIDLTGQSSEPSRIEALPETMIRIAQEIEDYIHENAPMFRNIKKENVVISAREVAEAREFWEREGRKVILRAIYKGPEHWLGAPITGLELANALRREAVKATDDTEPDPTTLKK